MKVMTWLLIVIGAVVVIWQVYGFVHDYYVVRKYGLQHNAVRVALNIPVIVADWEYHNSSENWILWQPIGDQPTQGKEIKFSGDEILIERDTYHFTRNDTQFVIRSNFSYIDSINSRYLELYINKVKVREINLAKADMDSLLQVYGSTAN